MILAFSLSMPNVGSWDGKWTGANNFYTRLVNFGRSKKSTEKAQKILDEGYFHYDFGDGWSAGITVKRVNANEALKIRKKTKGFCGYDWMIASIQRNGKIIT